MVITTNLEKPRPEPRFLIVDNSWWMRVALMRFFKNNGYNAAGLSDSRKVKGWLESNPCDGILWDIHVKKVDVLAILADVRKTYTNKELPIVIFAPEMKRNCALLTEIAKRGLSVMYLQKIKGPREALRILVKAYWEAKSRRG